MTQEELQKLVEEVSLVTFGKPFRHQAIFNSRLKTTGGRYHLKDHHLDFNHKMLAHGKEIFIGIIKHELCHYHLHLEGKGYQHKDWEFKELLAKTGGSRFAPSVQRNITVNAYQCQQCGKLLQRCRKINTSKYVCGHCHGKLKWLKAQVHTVGK